MTHNEELNRDLKASKRVIREGKFIEFTSICEFHEKLAKYDAVYTAPKSDFESA